MYAVHNRSSPVVRMPLLSLTPRFAPLLRNPRPERTSHMDAPPREQRARAAFFREKEARRIAKKQRKKERLLAKVAHSALSSDVAPPLPQSYSSGK